MAIEDDYFTYEGWNQADTLCFGFTDVVLKRAIGTYGAGTKLSSIWIDYAKAEIHIYVNDTDQEPEARYQIHLSIGDAVVDGPKKGRKGK